VVVISTHLFKGKTLVKAEERRAKVPQTEAVKE
jgi:hypothetical protein